MSNQDFRSLASIEGDMSENSSRRLSPENQQNTFGFNQSHLNAGYGEDDIEMRDMLNDPEDTQEDTRSRASTESYASSHLGSMEAEIKEDLPSHLFKEIRNLPSAKGARRNIRSNTAQSLRRHGATSRESQDEIDGQNTLENCRNERDEIKHMATSLDRKKSKLTDVQNDIREKEQHISTIRYYRLRFAAKLENSKKKAGHFLHENKLWTGALKEIQGKFGTGVLSYFVFLRWLFVLNIFIFLLMFVFIFIPQIIYRPSTKYGNNQSFSGLDILDGSGWFNSTELYYGYYTKDTMPMFDGGGYKMPLAYFLTCGSYLLLCLIILVRSMASLYKDIYLQGGSAKTVFTIKIFTSWDYTVTDRDAANIKQLSIGNNLIECLAETKERRVLTFGEKFKLLCLRAFTHFVCFSLIAAATYLIVEVVSGYANEGDPTVFKELLLPLLVSFLNLVLPFMFRIVASFENYELGSTAITMSLARTVLLKMCTLAAIFVALYREINCSNQFEDSTCNHFVCWENYVGQTFYRLVWVDFAFILLATFFGEFVRRQLSNHVEWWRDNIGNPGFDISRNVLDLIYAQCLCWFGTFFSPLLSFICLLKLWFLFYVKKISVLNNCRPSVRPFLASKMNLLFLFLLGISYALVLVVLGFIVTSTERRLTPSNCGPFQGQETIHHVILLWIDNFPRVLKEIVKYIASPSIIALIFILIGVFIYYYKLLKDSNEKKIKLLREQITLTGKDKLFLLKKIRQLKTQ